MTLLNCGQRLGAVGQGLFYWGALSLTSTPGQKGKFTFLFDCGSSSTKTYLQREIALLIPQLSPSSSIDLLVISHLDYDHVSGLDTLLAHAKAEVVVLPYLEPAERLSLLIRAPRGNDWYQGFLSGPANFLKEKGAGAVVYVSRGERDDMIPSPEGPEGPELGEQSLHLDIHKLEPDPETQALAQRTDGVEATQATFAKDNLGVSLRSLWQFIFHVSARPDAQVRQLKQLVESERAGVSLATLLQDRTRRKDLSKTYRKAFEDKDLNHTCLACIHGPLFSRSIPWCSSTGSGFGFASGPWLPFLPSASPYWHPHYLQFIEEMARMWLHDLRAMGLRILVPDYTFLMGDLTAGREISRICSRFENYLPRVRWLQVPHHGARSSWADCMPSNTPNALFAISAGMKNRFGHPHPEVLQDISDAGLARNLRWINEFIPLSEHQSFLL